MSNVPNVRLSRAVCSATANILKGSHKTLESLFLTSGVPGPPPALSHADKWKDWLFAAGQNPDVDSLAVLGNILEQFMDVPPPDFEARAKWEHDRDQVVQSLERDGLRYYRGGRVLPNGQAPDEPLMTGAAALKPTSIHELLLTLLRGFAAPCILSRIDGRVQCRCRSRRSMTCKTCFMRFFARGCATFALKSSRRATPVPAQGWTSFCRSIVS